MTVKDRIGTLEGVLTVRVDSRNPKTADGFNTFIFRRPVEESLRLLAATPIIDAVGNPLPEGIVVGDKSVRYTPEEKKALIRFVVERAREQYGPIENPDFGEFEINSTFASEVQRHAFSSRRELEAVSSARQIASSMIHFVASPNEELSAKRHMKCFEYGLARVRLSDGEHLAMGVVGIGATKRPFYDQHVVAKLKADSEVTSLQGQTRIGEPAFDAVYDNRFRLILQGVAAYFDLRQDECMRLSRELWLGKSLGETHGWISQSEIDQHFNNKGNI